MGITIHYNGKLDDRARFAEMLDAARLYCAEQRWHALEVDERIIGHVERIVETRETTIEIEGVEGTEVESFTQSFPIDDTMRGLLITVHPKSEPVWLTFNEAGEMVYYMAMNDVGEYWENKSLFTKTHFAGVQTHIAVCEFLHWLQNNYMPGLSVYDEGDYFESGDEQKLAHAFGFLNSIMDRLQDALENPDSDDPEAQAMRGVIEASLDETDEAKPKRKKLKVERGKEISKPDPQWKRGRGISANKN
ncbi:MAG: hypothetical protein HY741_04800 [Chloroflexi bacterium]|nr:hypothetical protein [Chloroflexota bacterium]